MRVAPHAPPRPAPSFAHPPVCSGGGGRGAGATERLLELPVVCQHSEFVRDMRTPTFSYTLQTFEIYLQRKTKIRNGPSQSVHSRTKTKYAQAILNMKKSRNNCTDNYTNQEIKLRTRRKSKRTKRIRSNVHNFKSFRTQKRKPSFSQSAATRSCENLSCPSRFTNMSREAHVDLRQTH